MGVRPDRVRVWKSHPDSWSEGSFIGTVPELLSAVEFPTWLVLRVCALRERIRPCPDRIIGCVCVRVCQSDECCARAFVLWAFAVAVGQILLHFARFLVSLMGPVLGSLVFCDSHDGLQMLEYVGCTTLSATKVQLAVDTGHHSTSRHCYLESSMAKLLAASGAQQPAQQAVPSQPVTNLDLCMNRVLTLGAASL